MNSETNLARSKKQSFLTSHVVMFRSDLNVTCCDMNGYLKENHGLTFRSPKGMGCQFHSSVFYLLMYDTSLFYSVFYSNQVTVVIGVSFPIFRFLPRKSSWLFLFILDTTLLLVSQYNVDD